MPTTAPIERVGERLVEGEEQRPEDVRPRVAPKLRAEARGDGFFHFRGRHLRLANGRLFLERVRLVRTPLAEDA